MTDPFSRVESFAPILQEPIWQQYRELEASSVEARIRLAYERARSLIKAVVDPLSTSLLGRSGAHLPAAFTLDSGAWTILTIHWNLCMGTISSFLSERSDLLPLLQALERFDTCGEFLLTELGHGLDARNIETTATHQADGSFVLHTPNPRAAKTMPPSSPHSGMARMAVVFARLMVADKDHGVRSFIVPLNDASGAMCRGVACILFPARPGAKAIDHASTSFRHVPLPAEALLGHLHGSPKDERKDFMRAIHRVTVGTLCLSTSNATVLRVAGCIAGRYSAQRRVGAPKSVPILSFSTQYGPIARILAHAVVFDKYAIEAMQLFMANVGKPDMQNVIAGTFKATVLGYTQKALSELVDRCGWQGLYAHNQISELWLAEKGNNIAEGDFVVLCIRLASEALLGRYAPPKPRDPQCLLARHESGVWDEARQIWASLPDGQRGKEFNTRLLPLCLPLVQATGQRMAYEAAKDAMIHGNDRGVGMTPQVLALYESTCMMEDQSWYVENGIMSRRELMNRNVDAVNSLLPLLKDMINDPAVDAFVNAPMVDQDRQAVFFSSLPSFQGSEFEYFQAKI
ncbi:Acyl-coenzyme A oxidase, peroxisomal [Lachnellula subtilissima]|uniref:Acyl-coenzyme A oxidase, peroxisomal n=1 Tax=Lachnellula subtilissima TaxID=602034 RepID=A0A8H8RFM7_9HELO|nr:Acyl-coenzyme A oxidase, peroxisomal [Lachnellula subtilissima]